MSDFDFSDLNLDFLQSTPPKKSNASSSRLNSPLVKADLNIGQRTNNEIRAKRRSEWAKKIASTDELLKEIKKLKCDKLQLQTQLRDFQKTALNIQNLYTSEKQAHELTAKAFLDLQGKYEKVDTDLVVKSLKCDQFEACLADQKDRPVDYNELAVKYLRIVHRLEGEDGLKGFHDRSMVEDLKAYCAKYKLKLMLASSPKKPRSRTQKTIKEDASTQCEIPLEMLSLNTKPETKCQSTQCQVEMRSQGTQHISTMTTRSTTTSCFITYRNVGTNCPETHSLPGVDDILKEFAPWQNITPISPLTDQLQSEENRKSFKTIGTCTWLCNIRRSIDFIPRNKLKRSQSSHLTSCDGIRQGIKEEVITPSPSPTPSSQPNVPASQHATTTSASQGAVGGITSNQNFSVNPLISAMNTTMQLSHVSGPSFHELWHIFGRMILGLLQNTSSNAGIAANSALNSESVNQQQFHNWLRELYESSVAVTTTSDIPEQSNSTIATNVEENNRCNQEEISQAQNTHSVGTSPIRFNDYSILSSTDIVRPQARRSFMEEISDTQEINVMESPECYHEGGNYPVHLPTEPLLPSYNTPALSIDNSNCVSNLTSTNEERKINSSKAVFNVSKKKHKSQILSDIQELFPEAKLDKDKRKALKRLLTSKKHKKKLLKDKHMPKQSSLNESLISDEKAEKNALVSERAEENDHQVETAIDFLKSIFENGGHEIDDYVVNTQHESLPKLRDAENVDYVIKEDYNPITKNTEIEVEGRAHSQEVEQKTHFPKTFIQNNTQSGKHIAPQGELCSKNRKSTNVANTETHISKPQDQDEAFLFTKPAEKCKKAKYSNKKELYSCLFGDSDTEFDESEDEENISKGSIKTDHNSVTSNSSNIKSKLWHPQTILSSPVHPFVATSQNSDVELEESEAENITPKNGAIIESNICLSNSCSAFEHHCNSTKDATPTANQDISRESLGIASKFSIPDIPTPVLQSIEMSLMSKTKPVFLFDDMDKETQHRLENIIDEQLEKIPPSSYSGETYITTEDFPSDFEKEFELSSEEECTSAANEDEYNEKSPLSEECDESQKSLMDDSDIPSKTFNVTARQSKDLQPSTIGNENSDVQRSIQSEATLQNVHQSNSSMELEETTIANINNYQMKGQVSIPFTDGEGLTIAISDKKEDISATNDGMVIGVNGSPMIDYREIQSNTFTVAKDIVPKETFSITSTSDNDLECSNINADVNSKIHNTLIDLQQEGTKNMITNIKSSFVNRAEDNSPLESLSAPEKCIFIPGTDISKMHAENSTVSTEEESSIIEISSDSSNIEETATVAAADDELIIDEKPTIVHKEQVETKELSNSRKQCINYPINICDNSEINKQSSLQNNAENINKQKPLSSGQTKCSLLPEIETQVLTTISAEEESSIFEISSDISDIERTRDVTTPNDELMIDENDADNNMEVGNSGNTNIKTEMNSENFGEAINKKSNNETNFEGCIAKSPVIPAGNSNESLNSSTISSILSSTLYMEILSDSLCPIIDDVVNDKHDEVLIQVPAVEKRITRNGRKRKSESQPDLQPPPCKRSERIKAKRNVLEQSLNLSLTPVEIGKYTQVNRNSTNLVPLSVNLVKKQPNNLLKSNETETQSNFPVKIGYFRETNDNNTEANTGFSCDNSCFKQLHPSTTKETTSFDNNEDNAKYEKCLNEVKESTDQDTRDDSKRKQSNIVKWSIVSVNQAATSKAEYKPTIHTDTTKPSIKLLTDQQTPGVIFTANVDGTFDCSVSSKSPVYANNIEYVLNTTSLDIPLEVSPKCGPKQKQNMNLECLGHDTVSEENTFDYSESPQSPQYANSVEYLLNTTTLDIPLELSTECKPQQKQSSLLENLINHFSPEYHSAVATKNSIEDKPNKRQKPIMNHYSNALNEYCRNPMNLDPDILASKVFEKLQQNTIDYNLLYISILKICKECESSKVKESDLPSIIHEMPPWHLSHSMQRLFYLLKHLHLNNQEFCSELLLKIESQIFNCQQVERISLSGNIHLTQLYLMACKLLEPQLREHPARIFIAKCIYFYSFKAVPMIHEVLIWYPTVLPHREDRTYDRSDALITVIQHCLMCYKYDMEKPDLRGKALISKLRYEYHYEPYKPSAEEVICNLVEKLKTSKFTNISVAFGLFCKRLHPAKTEPLVLQTHLLPLANEFFNKAQHNDSSYDIRISALLEIISTIVKPFPLDWNIEVYLNLFSRFLNAFNRKIIQEASVCSILRLQRFGYVNCFNRLRSFKPSYELNTHTQAMFKTFIYRKKLQYLKTILVQNPVNIN